MIEINDKVLYKNGTEPLKAEVLAITPCTVPTYDHYKGNFYDLQLEYGDIISFARDEHITLINEEEKENETMNTNETILCSICGCVIENAEYTELANGNIVCNECRDNNCWQCADCDEWFEMNEMYTTADGDHICETCLEDDFETCNCCGSIVPREDGRYLESYYNRHRDDGFYCDDCLENEDAPFRYCQHCEEYHHVDEMRDVVVNRHGDTESWCESCRDDVYYCEECGNYVISDLWDYDNECCVLCAGRDQNTGNIADYKAPYGVTNYGYKPNPCFCPPEAKNEICFGFELEMEDAHNERNLNEDANYMNKMFGFTYCKHDGSLDNGIELVSHPMTYDFLIGKKELFKEVFKQMVDWGYTSHNNGDCGLHFHISLKPMIEKNEHAVYNMLYIVDRFWSQLVTFSRRTEGQLNSWAKRYSVNKDYDRKRVVDIAKEDYGRYMAVNLQNTHTIEIRMMRGTLNIKTFIATAQMIKRLTDLSVNISSPAELQNLTWENVLSCEFTEMKEYWESRLERVTSSEHDPNNYIASENLPPIVTVDTDERPIAVGDRVRVTGRDEYFSDRVVGQSGTVRHIRNDMYQGLVCGIDFDISFSAGHNCDRHTREGHGQWVQTEYLERIIETPRCCNCDEPIIETHNNNGVTLWF